MPAPDYATEIAQLETALSSGHAEIMADGEKLTYRSATEILTGIRYFEGKAARTAAAGRPVCLSTVVAFGWD